MKKDIVYLRKRDNIFFCIIANVKKVLTTILVNDITILSTNDKENCHFDKNNLQKEGKNMPLENRLKEFRARIGVNQQEMGKLVSVSRQTISQIERGDYSPSVTLALKIAKVFDAKVEDIFSYTEEENE